MAKESSFDIVSTVDMQEVDNAYQQAKKALRQRYDLKDTNSDITLDKDKKTITVSAPSDFVVDQIVDIIASRLIKRDIDIKSLTWGKAEDAAGATVRKTGSFVDGIDRELSGKINKDIKAKKFKAKVQIEGDKLRVSSPSRDTLQEIIAFLRDSDYGIPLQFVNYR